MKGDKNMQKYLKAIKDLENLVEINTSKIREYKITGMYYNKDVEKNTKDISILLKLFRKQQKELETWKKIAEKLAEDKIIPKCKNCSDEDTHECTECALEWARNEVKNDD